MKFFTTRGNFIFVLWLTIFLIACQKDNSVVENKNQSGETRPSTVSSNSNGTSADEYCEKVYREVLQKYEQDYVSCLSDVKVETEACPKPDNFDDGYKENLNIVIALDASGSMSGKIAGRQKLEIAKDAITTFVNGLPARANVGLIAYGHRGSNSASQKQISCEGIEQVYPVQKLDKNQFLRAVNSFQPTGWTPVAGAISKAGEILKNESGETATNLVYIVSDGIETCGGDPVQAAANLHQSNIKAIVNIIGFDVDSAAQQQLKAAAEAGGGQYSDARNAEELNKVFGGVSKSVAEYNEYLRCMTANKQDVFRLYSNKQSQIFLCVTNKSNNESQAIRSERTEWSRAKNPRDKCAGYVIQRQNERELRIRNWKNEINQKIQTRKETSYEELERELKSVTDERENVK